MSEGLDYFRVTIGYREGELECVHTHVSHGERSTSAGRSGLALAFVITDAFEASCTGFELVAECLTSLADMEVGNHPSPEEWDTLTPEEKALFSAARAYVAACEERRRAARHALGLKSAPPAGFP